MILAGTHTEISGDTHEKSREFSRDFPNVIRGEILSIIYDKIPARAKNTTIIPFWRNFKRNPWKKLQRIFRRPRTNPWRNFWGIPGGLSGEMLRIHEAVLTLREFVKEFLEKSLE